MQHRKCRRNSALEIMLRISAVLMSLALIIGILPLAVFAEDADNTKFKNMINPGVPQKYSDDMANTADDNSTRIFSPLAIAAIGISGAALLWNVVTLIIAIICKKSSDVSV